MIPAGPPPATQQRVEIVSATMSVLGVEVSTRAGSSVKPSVVRGRGSDASGAGSGRRARCIRTATPRSEEHTSELQSHHDLVCRLLLEKKKKKNKTANKREKIITNYRILKYH